MNEQTEAATAWAEPDTYSEAFGLYEDYRHLLTPRQRRFVDMVRNLWTSPFTGVPIETLDRLEEILDHIRRIVSEPRSV